MWEMHGGACGERVLNIHNNLERPSKSNTVQLSKEDHWSSEVQKQRQPDACKNPLAAGLGLNEKKPLPFAGKEKRKKYYLLFIVVVAIPLSHGKGLASAMTSHCKRNDDLPSGEDVDVFLLGPRLSVAHTAPEQSWIYFGNFPCHTGLGFRMERDENGKHVVKDYYWEPYDTITLVGTVHFPSDQDIMETVGRIDDIPSMMAKKRIPLTNRHFISFFLEMLEERKFYTAKHNLLLD
ncbi:hypothetical protein F5876DRAFT_70529 [Lentinula aff. lateritia]|uniref:Uncharacterized protein n=1 Tax=Lentinula aff. lateritia TaxID=2804960 RepID=A0ACC1TIW8_9AGAR|nr:hypothetical protein F5876DRAFT_70529 [Lentinula aff. lateritia]